MGLALYIIGSMAACVVLYIFVYGIIIALGAEYEWTRGRRIRGGRAVLLGLCMVLSVPLFTSLVWLFANAGLLDNFWNRAGVAAIITAVGYAGAIAAITRKLDAEDE